MRWIVAVAIAVTALFSPGAAFAAACKDISVADLQLMTEPELDTAYCWNHFIETVDREGLDKMRGNGEPAKQMRAEWDECVETVTRVGRVLRAGHKAAPPECDGGQPRPRKTQ